LLDIKFRRQSRIRSSNALRTTRSTFALKWIGFSEDDVTNTTGKKKLRKSWSFVQIFGKPLQTTGKQEKSVDAFLAF